MKKQFFFKNNIYRKKKLKALNKTGQVTVEYILLAVVLITLFQVAAMALRKNESLKSFQEKPGQIFRNLVANGNWEIEEEKSNAKHPNHYNRFYSPDGEGPK